MLTVVYRAELGLFRVLLKEERWSGLVLREGVEAGGCLLGRFSSIMLPTNIHPRSSSRAHAVSRAVVGDVILAEVERSAPRDAVIGA